MGSDRNPGQPEARKIILQFIAPCRKDVRHGIGFIYPFQPRAVSAAREFGASGDDASGPK